MTLPANDTVFVRQHRPISCAECRRLKLRCNRTFPCSSCERRGCVDICPDGILPTAARKTKSHVRNFHATTTEQGEIDTLRERVRELERALTALQSSQSSTPQPDSQTPEFSQLTSEQPLENVDTVDELTENLGTLSMTGYGKSRFFGTIGGALQSLDFPEPQGQGNPGSTLEPCLQDLPADIVYLSSAFLPRRTPNFYSICNWMVANLPPFTEAWSLCETFFENGAYILVPIWRTMFMEEIFAFFYGEKGKNNVDIPQGHRLALLYIVFALGELFDLNRPARPTGGNRFYYLARAALALEPLYDQPTLTAVQAHLLICVFLSMSDHGEAPELVYAMSAMNVRLCFTLGLHREWKKFSENAQPDTDDQSHTPKLREQEIRRIIFLTALHFEVWQCLQYGRPSQLNFDQFDFAPPGTFPERCSFMATEHMKSQAWSYGFLRDCAIPVLHTVVSVKPPNYSEVIKLEKKIENYPLSVLNRELLHEHVPATEKFSPGFVVMQFSVYSLKETLLLCLHRQYFSFAMTDYSRDPLGCPFARSVFGSFVASCKIVSKIGLVLEREPKLSVRIYLFWVQLLIPCIFGTIVIRSPGCSLASTALAQLDRVCAILRGASGGFKAATLLPHALKLQGKAHTAYNLHYSFPGAVPHAVIDISKELSALGGKSRVSPSPNSAGSPAAPEQQDMETGGFVRDPSFALPSVPSAMESQSYHVENLPSVTAQSSETTVSQLEAAMDYAQWEIGSAPGTAIYDNFSETPQNTNTNTHPIHIDHESKDLTNQLLSLFAVQNDSPGFATDMTYPDPPNTTSATQHTSWDTFFSYMLQS